MKTVRLDNNNLDENSLLGLLQSLTDEPLPSGETRSVTINGNPGVTQAVRDEAAKLKNWIVGI